MQTMNHIYKAICLDSQTKSEGEKGLKDAIESPEMLFLMSNDNLLPSWYSLIPGFGESSPEYSTIFGVIVLSFDF